MLHETRLFSVLATIVLAASAGCGDARTHVLADPNGGGFVDGRATLDDGATASIENDSFTYRTDDGPALRFRTEAILRGGGARLDRAVRFAPTKARDAVEVSRSGIVERLRVVEGASLEQTWTLASKPMGEGDLVVHVGVRGAAHARTTESGLVFGDGDDAVEYGHGTFVDARGVRTHILATSVENGIELRVPEHVLEAATYPAVLDPIIGPPHWPIVSAPLAWTHAYAQTPQAVWNGTSLTVIYGDQTPRSRYLFLVTDASGQTDTQAREINGLPLDCAARDLVHAGTELHFFCTTGTSLTLYRLSLTGVVLGSSDLPAVPYHAAIARGEGEYLLVWGGAQGLDDANVLGMRLTSSGSPLDVAPFTIANGPRVQWYPSVVFTGSDYLVAYDDDRYVDAPTRDIRMTHVSTEGAVSNLDGDVVFASPTAREGVPHLDRAGSRVLLSFDYAPTNGSGTGTVRCVELDANGVPSGAAQPVASATAESGRWRVAWSGTEWLFVTHSTASSQFNVSRWNPTTNATGAYEFDRWFVSVAWDDLVWTGAGATMVIHRNFNLTARVFGPTSQISATPLDTFRPAMLVQDVASDGVVYAVAYAKRESFGDSEERSYVAMLSPDGTLVGQPFELTSAPIAVTPDATRRNISVESAGDGLFMVYARNVGCFVLDRFAHKVAEPVCPGGLSPHSRLSWDGSAMLLLSGIQARRLSLADTNSNVAFTLSQASGGKTDLVGHANGSTHLAVWSDGRTSPTTGWDIYASRVRADGTIVDQNAIAITTAAGDDTRPEVAATPSGWLVAWRTGTGSVALRFVALDGTTPDATKITSFGPLPANELGLSFKGNEGLLIVASGNGNGLAGTTLDERGVVQEGPFDLGTMRPATGIGGVASIGVGHYLVAYESLDEASEHPQMFVRIVSTSTPLGTACDDDSDCGGRSCVDGVCCASACGGGATDDCMACSRAAGSLYDGTCSVRAANTTCRSASGACDRPEVCNGASPLCPADAKHVAGHVCRVSAGTCDIDETCNGTTNVCPADEVASAGTVCRASRGACDVPDLCSGTAGACPPDAVALPTFVCRPRTDACDVEEQCGASTSTCPVDRKAMDGASCDDGLGCNGLNTCEQGICVDAEPLLCAVSTLACRMTVCEEPGICVDAPVLGCCTSRASCDDGDPCTRDSCSGSRRCIHSAIEGCVHEGGASDGGTTGVDATVSIEDAGSDASDASDDAETPRSGGSCAVSTSASSRPSASALALLVLMGLFARRSRTKALRASVISASIVGALSMWAPRAIPEDLQSLEPVRTAGTSATPTVDVEHAIGGQVIESRRAFERTARNTLATTQPTYAAEVRGDVLAVRASDDATQTGTLELETRHIGRSARPAPRSRGEARVANDGTVLIERDVAVEHIHAGEQGVEQSWSFEDEPVGHGDLEVTLSVSGLSFAGTTSAGLHFVDARGRGIRYGHATFIDAEGRSTRVEATFANDTILLRVPEETIESARYPAVLDPVIAPETGIDTPLVPRLPSSQNGVVVAASPDQFLLVWVDDRNNSDIRGARVTKEGRVLDPLGISIAGGGITQGQPAVVFGGTSYLVVWSELSANNGWDVLGGRVSLSGAVLDGGGFAIARGPESEMYPVVAFDGTNSFVAWSAGQKVIGTRVSSAGVVLDSAGLVLRPYLSGGRTDICFDGQSYLLAWVTTESSQPQVRVTRFTPTGDVLDPVTNTISSGTASKSAPKIAFDGTHYLVGWSEDGNVRGRLLNRSAFPVAGVLGIASGGGGSLSAIVGNESGFIVFWSEGTATKMTRVSAPGEVLDPAGLSLTPGYATSAAAARSGSHVLVAWSDFSNVGGTASDIFAARIDASASVLDASPMHVTAQTNEISSPALATDGSAYFAAWRDTRGAGDIYGARIAPSGAPIDTTPIAIATSAESTSLPDAVYDGKSYVVWWRSDATIAGARISSAGVRLDTLALEGATLATSAPAVATNHAGHVVVLGRTDASAHDTLVAVRFDENGSRLDTTPIVLAEDVSVPMPAVAFDGTSYLVTFVKDDDVWARFLSPTGAIIGDAFVVSSAAGAQSAPSVTFHDDVFLIAWEDHRDPSSLDIFGARVSPAGTVLDPTGIPIVTSAGDQTLPSVSTLEGTFFVAWNDRRTGSATVRAAQVLTTGIVVDASGMLLSSSADGSSAVSVASSGGLAFVGYVKPVATANGTAHLFGRRVCSAPIDAVCDGIDADCDGRTDESFAGTQTTCGVGLCASTGLTRCAEGHVVDTCHAGVPLWDDTSCDGVDSDCNGVEDEDFVEAAVLCGVGACTSKGIVSCVGGVLTSTCVVGTPASSESCNTIDDDCDMRIDESLTCTAGDGGTPEDAGMLDAGTDDSSVDAASGMTPATGSGGGCAAARTRTSAASAVLLLIGLLVVRARRRARR